MNVDFREEFSKCARRHHGFCISVGAAEHRLFHFENCPAESCKNARRLLGLRINALDPAPGAPPALREPGEEG